MPLDAGLYLDHLRSDGPALARAAESVLDRAVPGCPEWSGRGLVGHIGVIHRWVAGILRQQARSRPDRSSLPPPPEADGELMSWYGEGLGELVGALGETDPATEVWTFQGGRGPALFWFRRMAHETALHRWDAESVSGDPERLPTPLAVDGIAELLEVLLARTWQSGPPPDLGGSLHIHATDADGEWTVRPGQGRLEVESVHGKGDAAVRGPAGDLLLFLWGRIPVGTLEVFGDTAIPGRWQGAVRL